MPRMRSPETVMSSRLAVPLTGVAIGLAMFAASAAGGNAGLGLGMLAIMVGYVALVVAFGGRSETVAILLGEPADERLAAFSLTATAMAGLAAIVVALAGFLWEIAHGRDGTSFAIVDAVAGIAYLGSLAWLRRRG